MNDVPSPSPRAPRISANQQATLITSEGDAIAVTITDLSVNGFGLRAVETLYVGENIFIDEEVAIQSRASQFRAKILWARGCEAGGVFLDSADLI